MKALVLSTTGPVEQTPLALVERPLPEPGPDELLVRVSACGVCHTELDEIEGRLPARLPVVPGHQIVGRVERLGPGASRVGPGDRVGIAWIHWACGTCPACRAGDENLCPEARWTGKDVDGGYAEYTVVPEAFAYPVPDRLADAQAAPLLCAGVIGYPLTRHLSASAMVHYWKQPLDLSFNSSSGRSGGALDLSSSYKFMMERKSHLRYLSLDIGMISKTVGFLPEETALDAHFGLRLGLSLGIGGIGD